jgi:tetratricopeptide (TPR) repeat protein
MIQLGNPDHWREERIALPRTEPTRGERYAVEALELAEKHLEPDDVSRLIAMKTVAQYRHSARRFTEAEDLFLKVLKGFSNRGALDGSSIDVHLNLAWHYRRRMMFNAAEEYATRALELRRKLHGPDDDHYLTLLALETLASVYQSQGRFAEVEELNRKLIDGFARHVGPKSPSCLFARTNLAAVLLDQGKHEEAAKEFEKANDDLREVAATVRSLRWRYALNLMGYGSALNKLGRFEEAETVLKKSLDIRQQDERLREFSNSNRRLLGEALIGLKRYEQAEGHLLAAYEGYLEQYSLDVEFRQPNRIQQTLELLVALYEAWGKQREADKWRAEYEKWIRVAPPPHDVRKPASKGP